MLPLLALTALACTTSDPILHDARAVRDMARLDLSSIVEQEESSWALLRIEPAPNSGAATIPGRVIDIDKEDTTQPVIEGQLCILLVGSWEMLSSFHGPAATPRGEYSFTLSDSLQRSRASLDELYRPLAGGGVVLCQHDAGAIGAGQFTSMHLLPGPWVPHLRPTYDAFRRDPGRFDLPAAVEHEEELRDLMTGGNPLLALLACRTLNEARRLGEEFVTGLLAGSRGYLQAAFTFELLDRPGRPRERLEEAFELLVSDAADASEVQGVALGLFAALIESEREEQRSSCLELLERLDRKQAALSGGTPADAYVVSILETVGLRAEKSGD